jgi:hypothetical protein
MTSPDAGGKSVRKADIWIAGFLMVFGMVMIFVIIPAQTSPGERYGVPPATVPMVAMVVVTVMAGLLLIRRLVDRRAADGPAPMRGSHWVYALGFAALLFAGLGAMKYLHFVPGGIVFMAALMLTAGHRKPVAIILVSLLVPCAIYAALWHGMRLPLP